MPFLSIQLRDNWCEIPAIRLMAHNSVSNLGEGFSSHDTFNTDGICFIYRGGGSRADAILQIKAIILEAEMQMARHRCVPRLKASVGVRKAAKPVAPRVNSPILHEPRMRSASHGAR